MIAGSFLYRDIWPLLTYELLPADRAEGAMLWVKIAFAVYSGILAPLIEPYQYIPLDPKVPLKSPALQMPNPC